MSPAAKRQKTLAKACDSCRSKKSKCDSVRPTCGLCQKKGASCVYSEKGMPGLRPGYGKGVEQRLSRLEETIQELAGNLRRVASSSATSGPDTDPIVNPSPGFVLTRQQSSQIPASEAPMDHQLWFGDTIPQSMQRDPVPTENIYRTPEDQPVGETVVPEFPTDQNIQSQDFTERQTNDDLPGGDTNNNHPLPKVGDKPTSDRYDAELPSDDVLLELAELFFKTLSPCVRLFHQPSFMYNLFSSERISLLHALTVIMFRYWDKPVPDAASRERYVRSSRNTILLGSFGTTSLCSAQALALVALDAFGSEPGTKTSRVLALLVNAVGQLGLISRNGASYHDSQQVLVRNENLEEPPNPSTIEEEERRALFWFVFTLDRFSSLSHGVPCSIHARNIRQRPLTHDAEWHLTIRTDFLRPAGQSDRPLSNSRDPWVDFIEIVSLLDRTHQFLLLPIDLSSSTACHEWQSRFRSLDVALNTWFERLPRDIRARPAESGPMWILIHAAYYAVVIRMHSIAAFPPLTSTHFMGSSTAARRCQQAVEKMVALFNRLNDETLDQLGPICSFLVWIASRNRIILWTNAEQISLSPVVPQELHDLIDVLRRMATRWESAQRYADLVQLILDTRSCTGAEARLRIFNDTRRTAYGIDKLLGQLATENSIARPETFFDWLDLSYFEQVEGSLGQRSLPDIDFSVYESVLDPTERRWPRM